MAKSVRNPPTSASSSGEDFQDRETPETQTVQPPNNPGTSLQSSNPGTWRPLERPLGTRPEWLYVKHQNKAGTSKSQDKSQETPENEVAQPRTDQRPIKVIIQPRNNPRPATDLIQPPNELRREFLKKHINRLQQRPQIALGADDLADGLEQNLRQVVPVENAAPKIPRQNNRCLRKQRYLRKNS